MSNLASVVLFIIGIILEVIALFSYMGISKIDEATVSSQGGILIIPMLFFGILGILMLLIGIVLMVVDRKKVQ